MRKRVLGLVATPLIAIGSLTYADKSDFIISDTENGTITVYSQDYSYGITIQDKNLGAENVGDYGYYFQWGNNHGNPADSETVTQLVDWNDSYENHGYDGEVTKFIKIYDGSKYINTNYDYWTETSGGSASTVYANWKGNNLWGGGNDNDDNDATILKGYDTVNHVVTNPDNRQGPCPEGYHIPSAGERQELMMLWCNANSDICSGNVINTQDGEYARANSLSSNGIGTAFSNDLSLPLAGDRGYYNGSLDGQGYVAYYWSSSPRGVSTPKLAWYLYFYPHNVSPSNRSNRATGNSIRCFKNSYVKFPKTLKLILMVGGDIYRILEVEEGSTTSAPSDPSIGILEGWYLEGKHEVFDFSTPVTENMTLYAKFSSCVDGYKKTEDGDCELETYTITYNLNGGTNNSNNPTSYTVESGEILLNRPTRAGYMFMGWTGSNGTGANPDVVISSGSQGNKTYNAVWLPFNDLNVYFLESDGSVKYQVMMDRNMGATSTYDPNNQNNIAAYGLYYQWGNNYGFPNSGAVTTGSTKVLKGVWSQYAPSRYASGVFIVLDTWMASGSATDNIWGGSSANTGDRRGPCPDGYYVPTNTGWKNTYNYLKNIRGDYSSANASSWRSDLLMPLAGFRTHNTNVSYQGSDGRYRSSSDYNGYTYNDAYNFRIASSSIIYNYYNVRSNGLSVRCFKDSSSSTLAIYAKGGTGAVVAFTGTVGNGKITTLGTPTRAHSTFGGWYSDSALTTAVNVGDTAPASLYAKWTCESKYKENADETACEFETYSITYNLNGGTDSDINPTSYTVDDETFGVYQPTKTGYMFLGWTGSNGTVANANIVIAQGSTGNKIYNAVWGNYNDIDIYSISSTGQVSYITLMDRNMGAGVAGTGVDSYGLYYQWGNNYGFNSTGSILSGTTLATWNDAYNNKGYNGYTFIKTSFGQDYWASSKHYDGLWGGSGDSASNNYGFNNVTSTNIVYRRGPCPEGYHVPFQRELVNLFVALKVGITSTVYSGDAIRLSEILKLPFAGYRSFDSVVTEQNKQMNYWTSSPSYQLRMSKFNTNSNTPRANYSERNQADSVRCFKDSYLIGVSSPITIHPNGGTGGNIVVESGSLKSIGEPTRAGYTFGGWYVNSDFTGRPVFGGDLMVFVTDLYAKWNAKETVVTEYTVTINSNNEEYGFVDLGSVTSVSGAIISEDGNQITIGGTTVTATPRQPDSQYTYYYSGWINTCGNNLTKDCTITAYFTGVLNQYELLIEPDGVSYYNGYGEVTSGRVIAKYGDPILTGENWLRIGDTEILAVPTESNGKYTYMFSGWDVRGCGDTVTRGCFIVAYFDRIENSYQVNVVSNNTKFGDVTTGRILAEYEDILVTSGNELSLCLISYPIFASPILRSVNISDINLGNGSSLDCHATVTAIPAEPDAQYTYSFSGWLDDCGDSVTTGCTVTANFTRTVVDTSDEQYTVTINSNNEEYGFVDPELVMAISGTRIIERGNQVIIGDDTVDAVVTPESPNYSYSFNGWTNTCGEILTGDCIITANFTRTDVNVPPTTPETTITGYTVRIWTSPLTYGHVDKNSVVAADGTSIFLDENKIIIGSQMVTVTVDKQPDSQYTYQFNNWTNTCGDTLTQDCTIIANIKTVLNTYKVTWKNRDGTILREDIVGYGTIPTYDLATPMRESDSKYKYNFNGWLPKVGPVTEDVEYMANFVASIKSSGGGGSSSSSSNNTHDSADNAKECKSMKYADIVGYQTGNNIVVLSWIPVFDGDIDLALWNPDKKVFERIKSVSATVGEIEYEIKRDGEHVFAFYSDCDTTPYQYKMDVKMTTDINGNKSENSGSILANSSGLNKSIITPKSINLALNMTKYNSKYSKEINQAYQFAYDYGLTNKSDILDANMGRKITRIQLAKMLSYFAINVLGKKPDLSIKAYFVDVTDELDRQYGNATTLAYQLGIMGINTRDHFWPKDEVTRAEFATALSRMLYGIPDGTGKTKYYRPHIVKLSQEGIISKTNPNLIERRGYVMLMLMRSIEL